MTGRQEQATGRRALRVLRYGESAVLVETDGLDGVDAVVTAVQGASVPGVVELVPAARTVLVTFDPARADHEAVAGAVMAAAAGGAHPVTGDGGDGGLVEIEVSYDGPDLEEVAVRCGVSVEEVIHRHTAATYRVAFGGFAPGFAYLRGLDPVLALARRENPRTAVPAGSVAIAAEWTAVYPTASPGGWHLLGHTSARTWDVDRSPPSLFVPGTSVRFRARL